MDQRSPYLHDRRHAYAAALQFHRVVRANRARLPRRLGPLCNQLSRAAQSVWLNFAGGAAARSRDVKHRHWNIARGSAGEYAAALDLVDIERSAAPDQLLSHAATCG